VTWADSVKAVLWIGTRHQDGAVSFRIVRHVHQRLLDPAHLDDDVWYRIVSSFGSN